MLYKVKVYPEFKKDREQWDAADNKRINDKITSLKEDPRPQGVEKLAGDSGNYRVRVGNFRIIYSISDEEILIQIVKVGDRKDIYK